MPDEKKHESETLSQQRKAREGFIELKKMQSGEIKELPTPELKPETIEEKADNFWYYYRWWVFAAIFIVIVVAITVKQCVSRVNYDLSVTVYTASPVGDKDCKRISKYFEKFSDDVNGDKEIHVRVFNCSYTEGGNRQVLLANNTKIQSILAAEYDAFLFITDDKTYEYLNNISDNVSLFEGEGIMLGSDFYGECEDDDLFKLPQKLRLSRRVLSKTGMTDNKKATACYKAAGELLNRLRKVD
ncbi:MAG: hypothetical protein J5659_04675 [Clostridia bacterium]|nr:hypothetical protein [Clostridia bacterium]